MTQKFVLAVHGGAGALKNISTERRKACVEGIDKALRVGYAILEAGGPSIDAVEAAVVALEDDPTFNAGKGSVCAADGNHYLDATIMSGTTTLSASEDSLLRSGAVSGVRYTKNPIRLARSIKDSSSHVFLTGAHADAFAKQHGLETVANEYFSTEYRTQQLQIARQKARTVQDHDIEISPIVSKKGTVGAVACDSNGTLAAGTSTGGRTNQHPGRVGDSAVVGAGTYAEDGICAVSATGWGEFFLEQSVASQIAVLIRDAGFSLRSALEKVVISRLPKDTGGVIAVNSNYELLMPYNTGGMIRGSIDNTGTIQIGIHSELSRSTVVA